MWQPLSSPDAIRLLDAESVAACFDPGGLVVAGTPDHLIVQDPGDPHDRQVLLPGWHVPRAVPDEQWPILVLSPRDDRVGVMALRLIRD